MHRFDQPQQQLAGPHPVAMPEDILQGLLSALEDREIDLPRFAAEISRYPLVLRRILQAANSATSGKWQQITDPVHAMSWLGSRRLIQLLSNLPLSALSEPPR